MADKQWFLLKHNDKQIRGPVSLPQLKAWAIAAKIGPMDRVSCDAKESWARAPMIPELQMHWLVELDDNYLYGPTSIAAIQEFISSGEIQESDNIINCLENEKMTVAECPAFATYVAQQAEKSAPSSGNEQAQAQPTAAGAQATPNTSTTQGDPEDRIGHLETVVKELQAEVKSLREGQLELLTTLQNRDGDEIPPDKVSYLI